MVPGDGVARRIVVAREAAGMNEILAMAWALGCPVSELTGLSVVEERLERVARPTDSSTMEVMQRELSHYLELDAYLEDQGIPPQL